MVSALTLQNLNGGYQEISMVGATTGRRGDVPASRPDGKKECNNNSQHQRASGKARSFSLTVPEFKKTVGPGTLIYGSRDNGAGMKIFSGTSGDRTVPAKLILAGDPETHRAFTRRREAKGNSLAWCHNVPGLTSADAGRNQLVHHIAGRVASPSGLVMVNALESLAYFARAQILGKELME